MTPMLAPHAWKPSAAKQKCAEGKSEAEPDVELTDFNPDGICGL
jgi:hypothetical protein